MLQDTEEKKGDTQTHTQSSQERTHWCTRLMIGQVRWGQCALLCADKQTWALTLAHLNLDLMFISADWDQSNAWWWKQQQGTKMHFWWSLLSFFLFCLFVFNNKASHPSSLCDMWTYCTTVYQSCMQRHWLCNRSKVMVEYWFTRFACACVLACTKVHIRRLWGQGPVIIAAPDSQPVRLEINWKRVWGHQIYG